MLATFQVDTREHCLRKISLWVTILRYIFRIKKARSAPNESWCVFPSPHCYARAEIQNTSPEDLRVQKSFQGL